MFTMPMHPVTIKDISGENYEMWTTASALSLREPSLAFDFTLPKNFDGTEDDGRGLSMLERYVDKLLQLSFSESSLFWHYALRHVPSDSLACVRAGKTKTPPENSKVTFVNDAGIDEIPDISADLGDLAFPMHGYAAWPIGDVNKTCFCGWKMTGGGTTCTVPTPICTGMGLASCTYTHGSADGWAIINDILLQWPDKGNETWECPDTDLSDAWGIFPDDEGDKWLNANSGSTTVKVAKLIASGRAGLRIGNAKVLRDKARVEGINPLGRIHKTVSDDHQADIALHNCAATIASKFDAASVAKQVTDDLFPVAQGVKVCVSFHQSA